jgi:hypothetical protein
MPNIEYSVFNIQRFCLQLRLGNFHGAKTGKKSLMLWLFEIQMSNKVNFISSLCIEISFASNKTKL